MSVCHRCLLTHDPISIILILLNLTSNYLIIRLNETAKRIFKF